MNAEPRVSAPTIRVSAHGKPYYETLVGPDGRAEWSPLYDALDFPGQRGIDEMESRLISEFHAG